MLVSDDKHIYVPSYLTEKKQLILLYSKSKKQWVIGWWNRIYCLVDPDVAILAIVILFNFLNVIGNGY